MTDQAMEGVSQRMLLEEWLVTNQSFL